MMSRTLEVAGVLALVLWTVGGLVAWSMVQGRVQVVFQDTEESRDRGTSEITLLREDLAQLRKDLDDLRSATQTGFDAVNTATRISASTITTRPATPASALAPAQATKPARKRGFLAFKLPDHGFKFDELQQFEIIPSLSRVGFDGKSTLHDFSGLASGVRGQVIACLARPDIDCSAQGEINARTLNTGHEGRDQEMFKHLSTSEHPKITFKIKGFVPAKVDKKAMVVEGTAIGEMTIRGVARSHKMVVKLSIDDSRRLLIEGEGKITLTEYKIPIPTAMGFIKMHDEVKIWIAVRARCLGAVTKAPATKPANEVTKEVKEVGHGAR